MSSRLFGRQPALIESSGMCVCVCVQYAYLCETFLPSCQISFPDSGLWHVLQMHLDAVCWIATDRMKRVFDCSFFSSRVCLCDIEISLSLYVCLWSACVLPWPSGNVHAEFHGNHTMCT